MPPRNQDRQVDGGTRAAASERIDKATPDLSAPIRAELASAIADLRKEFFKGARAYKMLGAAGFAGYMALLFISIAIWAALATVLASGTAAIIVAFIWAVAGAVLYILSRRMREVGQKPGRTAGAARDLPGSLRGGAKDLAGTLKRAVRR
jgi:hypothetical protein